jgi:spore maturation protein CgeB
MRIAFFGSSILSSYWNGAATYYRGLLRSLTDFGYDITFYEPDAYGRQQNRDVDSLPWVRSVVYDGTDPAGVERCLQEAGSADVVVKASGVGVFDQLLEHRVAQLSESAVTIFWDVDAPATLDRVLSNGADPFRPEISRYDAVFTYGGGGRVVETYRSLGAKLCSPIYNAVDPETHHPVPPSEELTCLLAFQGNRLPDREKRVEEFFLKPAAMTPDQTFILGGSGWGDKPMSPNVKYLGHVSTQQHNAFNSSARFVLNINRDSMASYGFSPPTRVFEAAAAAACLVTDAWEGIDMFLQPGREILIAREGNEVAELIRTVPAETARAIGDAARKRILEEHTYRHRASEVHSLLKDLQNEKQMAARVFA